MDKLWAPWRIGYVTKVLKQDKKGNVFSRMVNEKKDKQNYIFIRFKYAFAVLNLYPYNNGHVLVVPNRKVSDLIKLTREEREDIFDLVEEVQSLLKEVIKPAGFNIGINLGRPAGAGIPEHLHVHVVPRWRGDINFMPTVANTKVISQSLNILYEKLLDAYKRRNRRVRK